MARIKTVYFSENHSEKWFSTNKEAEDYDHFIEIVEHVYITLEGSSALPKKPIEAVVKAISKRYNIEERWDWPRSTSEEILANEKPAASEDTL